MTYTVSQLDLARERNRLLELWRRNLPEASAGRFAWLYQDGPASGWFVHDEDGAVVGAIGLMDRRMRVFDRVLSGGQAIDMNVDRDHRTVGPALGLQRAMTAAVGEHRLGLIYGLPNEQSKSVLKRAGYRTLGTVGRWVKPLQCKDALPDWLRNGAVRSVASTAVDALLRIVSPETVYRRAPGVRVEVTDHFDARFDTLWHHAAGRFPVVGERTAAYLDWRFGRCPDSRHRVLCLSDAQDRLSAYLVYSLREGDAYISDFFFTSPDDLDTLLAEFVRMMRQQKARAIITVFFGSTDVCRRLTRFGFRRRPSTWTMMMTADPAQLGPDAARIADEENWFLTRADIDTDF